MIFRQLFDGESFTYTYLLASRPGGEALIIDPVLDRCDRYITLLDELDLKLVKAIDTIAMLITLQGWENFVTYALHHSYGPSHNC